jgi:frataxin-like iron-binding protein CyaY
MKEEIRKKIENELANIILDFKLRKHKIAVDVRNHMEYVFNKKNEVEKMFKKLKEGLSIEESWELSDVEEGILIILDREYDYWYNAYRVIKNELISD